MIMPLGTYITLNRLIGLAADFCSADSAGHMLSSSGSATIEPMPRRTARRGRAFFMMIIVGPFRVTLRSTGDLCAHARRRLRFQRAPARRAEAGRGYGRAKAGH